MYGQSHVADRSASAGAAEKADALDGLHSPLIFTFSLQSEFLGYLCVLSFWKQPVTPLRLTHDLHIRVCGRQSSPPTSSYMNCISCWYLDVKETQQQVCSVWGRWLLASHTSWLSVHSQLIPQLQCFPPEFMVTWNSPQ